MDIGRKIREIEVVPEKIKGPIPAEPSPSPQPIREPVPV